MSYFVREWDPGLKAWVLFQSDDDLERAKEKGRAAWRRGAAGIKIDHYPGDRVSDKHTVLCHMRKGT